MFYRIRSCQLWQLFIILFITFELCSESRFGENEYEYNASGIRTSKTINGTKTKFYVNGTQILRQEDDENKIDFLYGTNGILGFMLNGEKYVYKKNIQGDIVGIVNESGVEIGKYVYDAWGKHKCLILTNNGEYAKYGEKTIYTNEEKEYNKVINLNPIRYRGYYYDAEIRLVKIIFYMDKGIAFWLLCLFYWVFMLKIIVNY